MLLTGWAMTYEIDERIDAFSAEHKGSLAAVFSDVLTSHCVVLPDQEWASRVRGRTGQADGSTKAWYRLDDAFFLNRDKLDQIDEALGRR